MIANVERKSRGLLKAHYQYLREENKKYYEHLSHDIQTVQSFNQHHQNLIQV
jgi:Mg2+ and Co2+ transporter CorA